MERTVAIVSNRSGLNVRLAARLAEAVKHMRSTVLLKAGNRVADARNILSVLALCATLGSPIDISAFGEDEREAARVVEQILSEWSGGVEAPPRNRAS
jgi:phosphotransferase system HPr (HPr) family protein